MSLDLSLLKRLARDEFIRHLETGHQEKDLIIESSLMKPMERIIGVSLLKEKGIKKIYHLEQTISSKANNVIYIITSDAASVNTTIHHIKLDAMNNIERNRWVLFYPGRNIVTDYLLETEGVMGDVIIDELALNFIPIESDVLSMEYPLAFRQLYIDRTHLPLFSVARALLNFQSIYGEITSVYTLGKNSFKLIELWKKTMLGSLPAISDVPPEVGHLIIIDRNIDPVTICSSQLTFEGLLSEVFSIKSGFIEKKETKGKFLLTGVEPIFNEIRNYPLSSVIPVIKKNIKNIQDKQAKNRGVSSVTEIKDFVSSELKNIQNQMQSLTMYLNFSEAIINRKKTEYFDRRLEVEDSLRRCNTSDDIFKYIEWNIVTQKEVLNCLKLLCLWSCTKFNNANKKKKYLMDLFLQSYGFKYLSTFYNLDCSGFFTNYNSESKITHKNIMEELELIPNETEPSELDIANIFDNKYRPLSSTLVEKILSQKIPDLDYSKYFSHGIQLHNFSESDKISSDANDVYAVFYLGGICHSEISCLRLIAKKYKKKIIVMTTSIINGSDIMAMHIDHA